MSALIKNTKSSFGDTDAKIPDSLLFDFMQKANEGGGKSSVMSALSGGTGMIRCVFQASISSAITSEYPGVYFFQILRQKISKT